MNTYMISMLAGSIVIFALYGLCGAKFDRGTHFMKRPWLTALLSFAFSVLFGVVLSRITYALLMQELDFEYDGIDALKELLNFEISNVSFIGGALGVFLGVLLANRLTRKGKTLVGMDIFAPFGALLTALFRAGEMGFGSFGAGEMLPQDSPLSVFPFALNVTVDGGYSYWAWNISMLSAVLAVACAVVSFVVLRSHGRVGLTATVTIFFLALPQIFCESLRKRGMFWLFVHAEEVIFGIIAVVIMFVWIIGSGKRLPFLRRWAPFIITVICGGLLIPVEFAIDGKLFDLSHGVCYAVMLVLLAAIGAAGVISARRWNAEPALADKTEKA